MFAKNNSIKISKTFHKTLRLQQREEPSIIFAKCIFSSPGITQINRIKDRILLPDGLYFTLPYNRFNVRTQIIINLKNSRPEINEQHKNRIPYDVPRYKYNIRHRVTTLYMYNPANKDDFIWCLVFAQSQTTTSIFLSSRTT